MLKFLTNVWSKHNKSAIACLSLVPLMVSCAPVDVPESPSDDEVDNPPTETLVTEETLASESEPASSEPQATSSSKPIPISDNQLIDIEAGMQYIDARDRLLEQGWVPVEAPEPGLYGVERMAYDAGFTEVEGCAGTELGQCRFGFVHPDEEKSLAVITYGGSQLEVGDWNIQPMASDMPVTPTNNNAEKRIQNVIPIQFQGEWNTGVNGCGVLSSEARLNIGLDQINFYESSGNVQEVMVEGDLKITVTAEYASEGEIFPMTNSFELSSDRSTLTDVENEFVRYRCPS